MKRTKNSVIHSRKRLENDVHLIEDLAEWIREYEYQVISCGNTGFLENKKIQELVPQVLRVLVRHLEIPSKEINK